MEATGVAMLVDWTAGLRISPHVVDRRGYMHAYNRGRYSSTVPLIYGSKLTPTAPLRPQTSLTRGEEAIIAGLTRNRTRRNTSRMRKPINIPTAPQGAVSNGYQQSRRLPRTLSINLDRLTDRTQSAGSDIESGYFIRDERFFNELEREIQECPCCKELQESNSSMSSVFERQDFGDNVALRGRTQTNYYLPRPNASLLLGNSRSSTPKVDTKSFVGNKRLPSRKTKRQVSANEESKSSDEASQVCGVITQRINRAVRNNGKPQNIVPTLQYSNVSSHELSILKKYQQEAFENDDILSDDSHRGDTGILKSNISSHDLSTLKKYQHDSVDNNLKGTCTSKKETSFISMSMTPPPNTPNLSFRSSESEEDGSETAD